MIDDDATTVMITEDHLMGRKHEHLRFIIEGLVAVEFQKL